ncbi:MAG: hypothetical protein ACRD27_11245 [Terracidiphilus sp.]
MKPFLYGKNASPTPALAERNAQPASTGMAAALRAHASEAGAASPSIDVVKEGDKVVRLVVTCSCGERMEIECIYPAGS